MSSAMPLPAETLTIAEVAERTGLTAHTLRYYEKAGLIDPVERSVSGRRRYAAADMAWIEFLMRLRDTGMSIADMQRFAELRRTGPQSVPDRLDLLREHRAQLARRIRDLQDNAAALDEKITIYETQMGES